MTMLLAQPWFWPNELHLRRIKQTTEDAVKSQQKVGFGRLKKKKVKTQGGSCMINFS